MDSRDSSPPPHSYHPQPSPPAGLVNQYPQTQTRILPHHQQPFPIDAYQQLNTNIPNPAMIQHQNPRFIFNPMPAAQEKPLDHQYYDTASSGGAPTGVIEPERKKRGRPRKYAPDDKDIGLGLASEKSTALVVHDASSGSATTSGKKSRGRPPGSMKRQLDALGTPGIGFTPHVLTVSAGEDVASTVMAFAQQGPRTVCILTANGTISNVTLRQASMSGGSVTYEGRFDLLSLSGSFMPFDENKNRGLNSALSVSLSSSDGRVLGGEVAGMLIAASMVKVVVGSFLADPKKPKYIKKSSQQPLNILDFSAGGLTGASTSQGGATRASPSQEESHEENDQSPPDQGHVPDQDQNEPPIYSNTSWPNPLKMQYPPQ